MSPVWGFAFSWLTGKRFDLLAKRYETMVADPDFHFFEPELVCKALENRPATARGKSAVDTILDVGCGTGLLGVMLARNFPDSIIDGVDISRKSLDRSADKGAYRNLQKSTLISYAENTRAKYDVVVASSMFQFVTDPEAFFRSAWMLLAKGGTLIFTFDLTQLSGEQSGTSQRAGSLMNRSGYYSHNPESVLSDAQSAGFENGAVSKPHVLRVEKRRGQVEGVVATFLKPLSLSQSSASESSGPA